jgi:hypothetical protein
MAGAVHAPAILLRDRVALSICDANLLTSPAIRERHSNPANDARDAREPTATYYHGTLFLTELRVSD